MSARADERVAAWLRDGGAVVAFRHALAPGTFDPPGFRLSDCATQRNLGDEGRLQARAIGRWFDRRQLSPRRVLSSPWCRCIDTATLAFGRCEVEPSLGSPVDQGPADRARGLDRLRRLLNQATRSVDGFDVWVTHMFVLADLTGESLASAEAVVLRADASGAPLVLGRLPAP